MTRNNKGVVKATHQSLTTQDMEQSGIKASINQNDLIEIIANEKYLEYKQTFESFEKEREELSLEHPITKECEKFTEELKKLGKNIKSTPSRKTDIDPYGPKTSYKEFLHLQLFGDKISKHCESRCSHIKGQPIKLKMEVSEEGETKVKKTSSIKVATKETFYYRKEVVIPWKSLESYFKKIDDFNKRLTSFYDSLPENKNINPDKLAKAARIALNKRIVGSQAPSIKKQLEQMFNVTI